VSTGRRWIWIADILLWLPLVMAGGSLLLTKAVAVPALIAALGLLCIFVSLTLLWVGVVQLLRRSLRVGDLIALAVYGIGAVLYSQLARQLSP